MYIIAIMGQSGSGKTTVGKLVQRYFLNASYIEVSDIVKEIMGAKDKQDVCLQHMQGENKPKAEEIYYKILSKINYPVTIISGIREFELHMLLARTFLHFVSFLLVAIPDVRQERLKITKEELEKLDAADQALGLNSFINGPSVNSVIRYDATSTTPEQLAELIRHDMNAIIIYENLKKI